MRYTTYDSLTPVRRQVQREIDRVWNAYRDTDTNRSTFAPAVDISETSERWLLAAELPGVQADDIEITSEDGHLIVKGTKANGKSDDENLTEHRLERVFGEFYRKFTLPKTANTEDISAVSKDGVLHISIPKQAEVQPKRIPVSLG
ncbi:MAG: Hsp20/alpha crystallin family protein [Gammaproteobacteria bacterium]